MSDLKQEIALVVPCFNEEKRISIEYWQDLIESMQDVLYIFVDDGSSDKTLSILETICKNNSARIVRLEQNSGKGRAIRLGLLRAVEWNPNLLYCGFIDADGAFSREDILRIVHLCMSQGHHFDAVISSRVALSGRMISRKTFRHYLGRIIATFLTYKWKGSPYDTQSGFKLMRNSQAFRGAISADFLTKWFSDIELLTRIGVLNEGILMVWEEPLAFWLDVEGSKLSVRDFLTILRELLIARHQVKLLLKEEIRRNGFN